jgi:hypothetical protein
MVASLCEFRIKDIAQNRKDNGQISQSFASNKEKFSNLKFDKLSERFEILEKYFCVIYLRC